MSGTFMKVLFGIAILLIVINLLSFVLYETADEPVRFSSILNKLDEAPTIQLDLDSTIDIFHIKADWGLFNGFRDFINSLGSVVGLIVYLCGLLLNLGIFVGYAFYLLGLSSFSSFLS